MVLYILCEMLPEVEPRHSNNPPSGPMQDAIGFDSYELDGGGLIVISVSPHLDLQLRATFSSLDAASSEKRARMDSLCLSLQGSIFNRDACRLGKIEIRK